jgi:hypothetical protein
VKGRQLLSARTLVAVATVFAADAGAGQSLGAPRSEVGATVAGSSDSGAPDAGPPDELRWFDESRLLDPSATLTLTNPWVTLPAGHEILFVQTVLDGWPLVECHLDARQPARSCGGTLEIPPGPHRLVIAWNTAHEPQAGKTWTESISFHALPRERISIDLTRLASATDGGSEGAGGALSRSAARVEPRSACLRAIERLGFADTCSSAAARAAATLVDAIERACAVIAMTDVLDFQVLLARQLERAGAEHAELPASRCRDAQGPWSDADWSVAKRSADSTGKATPLWTWARSTRGVTGSECRESAPTFEQRLGALRAALRTLAARLALVEDLEGARADARLAAALAATAMVRKWSLDPNTVDGVRNELLLKLFDERAYVAWVAGAVASDATLNCGLEPEASLLAGAFQRAGLSRAQWKAVSAMMARTSPKQSMDACAALAALEIASEVSHEERLAATAQLDCAATRAPAVRGRSVSKLLRPDSRRSTLEVRVKLLERHGDCIR